MKLTAKSLKMPVINYIFISLAVALIAALSLVIILKPADKTKLETMIQPIPFSVETISDPNMKSDQTIVKQEGQAGEKRVTIQTQNKNGKAENSHVVKETVTKQPVNQIKIVGTKSSGIDISAACQSIPTLTFCTGSTTKNNANPAVSSSGSGNSGHDAGYNYAEQYEICDPDYSNGKSASFNEGVIAWEEDNCD